jgi:hypothetical protein
MKTIAFAPAAAMLLTMCAAAADKGSLKTAPLSPDYAKWRDLVRPNVNELSQQKIAWRTSVLHGIVDAQMQDRPVMILLMNGHPLGCT